MKNSILLSMLGPAWLAAIVSPNNEDGVAAGANTHRVFNKDGFFQFESGLFQIGPFGLSAQVTLH
jgi:hypothetical protein